MAYPALVAAFPPGLDVTQVSIQVPSPQGNPSTSPPVTNIRHTILYLPQPLWSYPIGKLSYCPLYHENTFPTKAEILLALLLGYKYPPPIGTREKMGC